MRIFTQAMLIAALTLAAPAQPSDQFEASILGEVKTQGKACFKPGATLMDLWLFSGGATPWADLESASLLRGERKTPLDLHTESLTQTRLQPGDILLVSRGKCLSVTGEVREPGTYSVSYKSKNPLEEALAAAGGVKETAALHRILLVRPSIREPFALDLSVRDPEGSVKLPFPLEDGDIVSVRPMRCVIIGNVQKPGQVVLIGQDTLFDIVSAAGANSVKQVTVIRAADVEAGGEKKEVYDLESAFSEASAIPKVPIFDGDLIFVPTLDGPNPQPQYVDPRYQPGFYDRVIFPVFR